MSKLHFPLLAALQMAAVWTQAQTSIGILGPGDADVALHVRASAANTAGPLRLEGLKPGSTETSVVVTDANGVLRYRSAASLMPPAAANELWVNTANVISPVANRAVAIGQTAAATASDILSVNGNATVVGAGQLRFRDGANYIYSDANNDNWYFKGRSYVSFRDRANATDLLTVQANSGRVGVKERNPNVDFEVNGTQRMTAGRALEFGSGANRVYRETDDDWRFVGRTQVNFMDRTNATRIMTVDALTRRVGIGAATPARELHVQGTMRLTGDVGTANLTSDFVLLADGNGDVRRATVAAVRGPAAGDNLGNHTATTHVQLSGHYLSGDGGAEGLAVDAAGRVGIGTLAPTRTLHVRESGTSAVAEVLIENAALNQNATLRFAEGNVTSNLGYRLEYDGFDNQLNFGNNAGETHVNIGRNSGNVAIGQGATPAAADKLLVNGRARVTANHPLYFGNDDRLSIARFPQAGGDAIDIVNAAGDVHVHATGLTITSEAIAHVATFVGATQRVGLGTAQNPGQTLHVAPANGDVPLRVEDVPTTPNNGRQYYRLLIDDNGVVYRTVTRYQGNTGALGPGKDPMEERASAAVELSPRDELEALREENRELRRQHAEMRAQVATLARTMTRLEAELVRDDVATPGAH